MQIGDVPGRLEPGTGEINYPFFFAELRRLELSRLPRHRDGHVEHAGARDGGGEEDGGRELTQFQSTQPSSTTGSKSAQLTPVGNARETRVDPSALFRAIVQSADDAITSIDLNETITSWNRAAERLYGYEAKEVIGKSNRLIIPPDRYSEEDDVIRRVKVWQGRAALRHGARSQRRFSHRGRDHRIRDPCRMDVIVGVSKIARDMSERKNAERNGARLAAIVESSDDAIVAKDLNGIITSWNRAAERMFGYTADEAIGQSIRLIIPESHQHEEDTILDRIRRGESVQHFETIRCRKDGSCLPISVTVSPIRDKAGTIIGASKIARDISERKRAEELAQRAQRQAEFVARMAEVLSGSLDYEARLKGLVELAVPAMADWAALDTVEPDGRMRRLAVAHADPAKPQLGTEIRRRHEDPITPCNARQVIRTGKGVLLPEVTDDMIVAAANGDDKRVALMRALRLDVLYVRAAHHEPGNICRADARDGGIGPAVQHRGSPLR